MELKGKGARVVESDGLENRCTGYRTVGSNPTLSADVQLVIPNRKNFR